MTRTIGAMLLLSAALAACGRNGVASHAPQPQDIPLTGRPVSGMESFDIQIRDLMRRHGIPGGAVAVAHDGKLIYARGFGYADVEARTRVEPDALFRIASVSKPITAVAILKLVEEGRLGLDDRVAPFISHLGAPSGSAHDSRWDQVTIRQLLQHTGGWDRTKSPGGFDPMFIPQVAADAVGAPAPASAETVIRYMKGQPFDFDPGAKYVYSNFGYAILGRVIEKVTGVSYEEYVRTEILRPMGATRTRIGRTRMDGRLPDEVRYYVPRQGLNYQIVRSIFPGGGSVPANYGGFYLEAMDAHGGWVSSTIDLLRFATSVDMHPAHRPDFLRAATLQQMIAVGPQVCPNNACWYALGWTVRPSNRDANWWHTGSLPGTTSILVRSYHNFVWVALFNARTDNGDFADELDAGLWSALRAVTRVPTRDSFPSFR